MTLVVALTKLLQCLVKVWSGLREKEVESGCGEKGKAVMVGREVVEQLNLGGI